MAAGVIGLLSSFLTPGNVGTLGNLADSVLEAVLPSSIKSGYEAFKNVGRPLFESYTGMSQNKASASNSTNFMSPFMGGINNSSFMMPLANLASKFGINNNMEGVPQREFLGGAINDAIEATMPIFQAEFGDTPGAKILSGARSVFKNFMRGGERRKKPRRKIGLKDLEEYFAHTEMSEDRMEEINSYLNKYSTAELKKMYPVLYKKALV